jgi:hypothetical protein
MICSGYMSPEYAMDGLFSIKSDVFSFGVLVLEIVSGQKNRGFYYRNNELNLLGHVSKYTSCPYCNDISFPNYTHKEINNFELYVAGLAVME